MPDYAAIHDNRLEGRVAPNPKLTVIFADGTCSLQTPFQIIKSLAGKGKIPTLFILCHGFAGYNERAQMSGDMGGMGLQLGKEDMRHANVGRGRVSKNKVERIVIYSCGAADTQKGNEGTTADGKYLMGALALTVNCEVYAADRIQWYKVTGGNIDFGKWEGPVWLFPPDGSGALPVVGAPVELNEI